MAHYLYLFAAFLFTIVGLTCVYLWAGWVGFASFFVFFLISNFVSSGLFKRFTSLEQIKQVFRTNNND